jgi:hypothetical protein
MKKQFPAVALLVLIFCQGIRAVASTPSTPEEQADFLAGIPLPVSSVLAPLQESSSYKLHQKELNDKWTHCKKVRYDAMQKWGEDHLKKEASSRDVVRYLFGGPDFLNAFAFFPDARVIVLGGLEPIGEVSQPESLKAGSVSNSLDVLRQALVTSLYCGYFITKEMKVQLHQGDFRGVLAVLYTELALTGNQVESVEMVSPFGAPGVKITYRRPGHDSQTLYYFQADLANGNGCQKFLSWLGGLGNGPAYLKAASYLLHSDSFSQTRDFLLNTSTLVVEDDSGIPFRHLNNGNWKLQVFGAYTPPLPLFSSRKQLDFDAAYYTGANSGPISFGAGYHMQPKNANLLLATRTGKIEARPVAAAPAPVPAQKKTPQTPVKQTAKLEPASQKKTVSQPDAAAPAGREDRHKSLAVLEDEERHIRDDKNLSREERTVLLQTIWRKQLAVMGQPPDAAGKSTPSKGAGKAASPAGSAPIQTAEPRPPETPKATDT